MRLTSGRHGEVAAFFHEGGNVGSVDLALDVPVVVGRVAPRRDVVLGRGPFLVLLDRLDPPPFPAVPEAFARTDGLTDVDARQVSETTSGVVAEGLSADGARALARALCEVGVGATAAKDDVLRLPPVVAVLALEVRQGRAPGFVARFAAGPPLAVACAEIAAVAAGAVRAEGLSARGSDEGVHVDVLVVGRQPRRLRLTPPPGATDDVRAIGTEAARWGIPVGRAFSPGASALSVCRRAGDLDRELAWVAWRAGRWPVAAF